MKTTYFFRTVLVLFMALLLLSCSSNRPANKGYATDRTGTNGATNGNGKVQGTSAHRMHY